MGCKAITPHLVGLAKRLEGKPFHLVASHCQRNPKEEVVSYIKSQKLAFDTPNFTVTSFGGHPKVKGNGYVPYYMVFDHRGELVHHHMCGGYHGGDGLAMIELVDKLLEDVPAIDVGTEPYPTHEKLARQVGRGKNLAGAWRAIQKAPDDPELARLAAALESHRDRGLAAAEALLATDPTALLPRLRDLAKQLKGTPLALPVAAKEKEWKASDLLKRSIDVWKRFGKERRKKNVKPARIRKLLEGNGDLPIAARIREFLE